MSDPLRALHEVAFSYKRSVAGADHLFLSGLAQAELWGSRGAEGRVTVPPVDWDPVTGAEVEGFVRLSERGIVRSWTWVAEPRPDDPSPRPFALALVQLGGADTSLLHIVDAPDESVMRTGMAVRADWRTERVGSIRDVRAFVPCGDEQDRPHDPGQASSPPGLLADLVVVSQTVLRYSYEPGLALTGFFRALSERRIQGGRCPLCSGVYVPPHSTCPACRSGPMDPVEMGHQGTVTAYTVVHIPFVGITMDLPFVCAWVRLDGADVPFAHLLDEIPAEEVEVGLRVEAVWVSDQDLAPTWESIRYFRPVRPSTDDVAHERP
ncbi:MAG: Zn-ribbon domain-containing OB-fold protein [Acidimicrobiales bacterium]